MNEKLIWKIQVKDLRKERDLTQEALANILGVSRQSINALESGRNLPSLPIALQLAEIFAVPLVDIFWCDELVSPQVLAHQIQNQVERAIAPTLALPEVISLPKANLYQSKNSMVLELQAPGYNQDELELELSERLIKVVAQPIKEEKNDYLVKEWSIVKWERTFELPAKVDVSQAKATFKNGILAVKMSLAIDSTTPTRRLKIN